MRLLGRRGTLLTQNIEVPIGAELGYAETAADFSLSGAATDIPGLTITIIKSNNRPFDIEYDVSAQNSTLGQGAQVLLYRDLVYKEAIQLLPSTAAITEQKHRIRRENLPAGTYIYKLMLNRWSSGTAILKGTITPCYLRAVQR